MKTTSLNADPTNTLLQAGHHRPALTLFAIVVTALASGCGQTRVSSATNEIAASMVSHSLGKPVAPAGVASYALPDAAAFRDPPPAANADEDYPGRFFLGLRGGVNAGSGEPANDIPTYGVYGRYRVRGPFLVGLAVDQINFDFEQPGNLIDVDPVGVVDANIDGTVVTAWGEYEFKLSDDDFLRRLRPFVGAGVGVGFLSDDDVAGPTEGGGTFAFDISGGTELIPGVIGGVRFDITRNVLIELGARFDYHITELEITDTVTGRSETADDYETFGGYIGLLFRL